MNNTAVTYYCIPTESQQQQSLAYKITQIATFVYWRYYSVSTCVWHTPKWHKSFVHWRYWYDWLANCC